jgi:hypothetical protein
MGHYLHKPNGSRLLAETLTAQIEAVLADETRLVCAEATANQGPSVSIDPRLQSKEHIPLAGSLSILTRARKPDGVVSHVL